MDNTDARDTDSAAPQDQNAGNEQGISQDEFADFDFDDFDDESGDLVPIIGLSAVFAAVVGAILMLVGRKRHPEPDIKGRLANLVDEGGKQGKRAGKQVAKTVQQAQLGDLLGEALDKAQRAGGDLHVDDRLGDLRKAAHRATKDVDLGSLLDDAISRARDAASNFDLEETVDEGRKQGGKLFGRAQKAAAGIDVAGTVSDVRKQATDLASSVRDGDVDTSGIESLLDTLKGRLGEAIDSVRNDLAPKAAGKLKSDVLPAVQDAADAAMSRAREDVLPAAQDALDHVREDVLPAAQKRAGKLASDMELDKRAHKVASAAKENSGPFGEMLMQLGGVILNKVVDELLPRARETGGKAMTAAREDILPAAASTAGDAAQHMREDILPKVAETAQQVAQQAPDVLSDMLKMARERAEEAMDRMQPVAADAFESGKGYAGDAATFVGHRAVEAAQGAGKVGSAAGKGAGRAVGTAVGSTLSFTKDTTGLLFWLGMLGGLIVLAFVPDRDQQNEIWSTVRQLLGEVRSMWSDLQGDNTDVQGE